MSCIDPIKKLRESVIFETAWLYETMPRSQGPKDRMVEAVTVIWNRSFGRAGFGENFNELCIDVKDIKNASEFWNSKDKKVFVLKGNNEITTEKLENEAS